jgi:hypothetical protein
VNYGLAGSAGAPSAGASAPGAGVSVVVVEGVVGGVVVLPQPKMNEVAVKHRARQANFFMAIPFLLVPDTRRLATSDPLAGPSPFAHLGFQPRGGNLAEGEGPHHLAGALIRQMLAAPPFIPKGGGIP